MYHIKEIEHSADIGFEISADTMPELFRGAVLGLYKYIIDPENISVKKKKAVKVKAKDDVDLLYSVLKKCLDIYYESGFTGREIRKVRWHRARQVEMELWGEILDPEEDQRILGLLKNEIKAVTYHQMNISFNNGQFSTKVIFDV